MYLSIYTDEIVRTADYLKEFELYAQIGKKIIPVTCYTNFRDALFHFRKIVNCAEEHEIMQQAFAVKEHLHRARTDAKTSVLFYFSDVSINKISDEDIDKILEEFFDLVLDKCSSQFSTITARPVDKRSDCA